MRLHDPHQVRGLTTQEAAERLEAAGPNVLPPAPRRSPATRLLHALRDPLSLLLLGAAMLSGIALGHRVEAGAILAIVVLNAAIVAVQEERADRATAALAAMTAPTATVWRDSERLVIDAAFVVPGDVIELAAGDRVPADAVLESSMSAAFDEALVTGESLPVARSSGEEILAGTSTARGRAIATVSRTGASSTIGAIAGSLTVFVQPPLVRELRLIASKLSVAALAIGAVLVPIAYARSTGNDALVDALLAGVALAVAAVPEGLATVVATALALGAHRMARGGAIVRRLPAIEALGSTTVLCTDKTGTLTTGRVSVSSVVSTAAGDLALWEAALRCTDAAGGVGDPIDVAIHEAAVAAGVPVTESTRIDEQPFDASTRLMAVIDLVDGQPQLSMKGAPEVVLARCAPGPEIGRLHSRALELGAAGHRVLAVARGASGALDATGLEPLGLVSFADPLRPSTADAVASCHRAGIRLVLVTGDHARTATAIASAAGLDISHVVTGPELSALDPAARFERLRDASIVARVDPATKVDLVEVHRAAGEVVAMTGDGVNDAPALRRADVGVAVAGPSGSDVAREAAGIVVTDEDLGTLVDAVREGRRIYRNLAAVIAYLVTGNISEILVVVGAVVLLPDLAVPLLPVQLLWVNLVTDGLPALALGSDDADGYLLDGRPRQRPGDLLSGRRLLTLIGAGVALGAPVIGAGALGLAAGWSEPEVRSLLLAALLIAHLVLPYAVRAERWSLERGWWRSRVLLVAIGGSLLLQVPVFGTSAGRSVLDLAPLPAGGWTLAVTAGIAGVAILDFARAMHRRFRDQRPAGAEPMASGARPVMSAR